MRCASVPSSVSSSRPSLSKSRRPAGYTPAGNPNSASVRRAGVPRSVNWHSTLKGLLKAMSMKSREEGDGRGETEKREARRFRLPSPLSRLPAPQGFTNRNVIRSLSPIAWYFASSFASWSLVGGNVHTPPG